MKSLQLFKYGKNHLRVVGTCVNPLFVAADLCNILEYSNTGVALRKLHDEDKLTLQILDSGQKKEMQCVTERGMCYLTFRKGNPISHKVGYWMFFKVLPVIKTAKSI